MLVPGDWTYLYNTPASVVDQHHSPLLTSISLFLFSFPIPFPPIATSPLAGRLAWLMVKGFISLSHYVAYN